MHFSQNDSLNIVYLLFKIVYRTKTYNVITHAGFILFADYPCAIVNC